MAKNYNEIKEGMLRGAWVGIVTDKSLPHDVYFYNAQTLIRALHDGWKGSVKITYNSPDWKLYEAIADNLFLYSGAKTFKMTEEILPLLLDKDGKLRTFDEFKEAASPVYDKYNQTWLETEYDTAVSGSREAAKWRDFEDRGVKLLRYVTANDETVCEVCGQLDNTVLPMDDGFWDENIPPLHPRCNCTIEPEYDESEITDEPDLTDKVPGIIINKIEQKVVRFKNNVGKTGMIFPPNFGYFKGIHTNNNFGLPIPAKHHLEK